ncbi:MAG: AAA family ATPase [Pseudomonadales bacterium]
MKPGLRDDPEAYIARDRRLALASGRPIADRLSGSALFADISGFTPLTETLRRELGPRRGVETLTANLDRVFHALIAEVHRFGGNVIYFSGDAITAWIDDDDGRRAVAAGLAMQSAMGRAGSVVSPAGTRIELALKVAIATGQVRRAVVGDPTIQQIDVLAGRLLDDLAAAEQQADKGEILLDSSTLETLGDRVRLSEKRVDPETGRALGLVESLAVEVADTPGADSPPLDPDLIRPWLLPVVYERISTGRGEFLAELRHAFPVFLRFSGLDFDDDGQAIDKLKAFVASAQQIFDRYGGNVLQLTLGDKGAYVYGVFGSPVAHEDDAARAASAALELKQLEATTAARDIRIGIGHGSLFSGTYGHARRRTFVCLGDAVNVAARLMSTAADGQIFATADVRAAAGDAFVWRDLGELQLKGKTQRIAAAELVSSLSHVSRRRIRYELPIFGRDTELQALDTAFAHALDGESRVVGISAEAGLGKSRLVAEFTRAVRRRETLVVFGECQSFGVNSSYFVWREIWQRLLDVDDDAEPEAQREAIESALRQVDPALVARAPLLADVIGVSIPDTDLTRNFDAKLRKSSLEDLLATCLRDRAAGEPVVIVLEDCHWLDEVSRDLLEVLVRASAAHRVLFVVAYRPAAQPGGDLGLDRLEQFRELVLGELAPEQTRAVIAAKAAQVLDLEEPPEALVQLVLQRAEGNPFYAEELLNYIASQALDPGDAQGLRQLQLPDSLHSLILSRIDALAENPRRTLKVASVIGRVFRAATLPGVYPDLGALDTVLGQLEELQSQDLVTLDQSESLAYLFRHVVTQEVSYDSMPFAIRSTLHRRVGEYIERTEADDIEPQLDLLAHHFWHGDDDTKKRRYLIRAEESARRRYANEAAIDYGERLLTLVDGADRAQALLRLGKVLELTGAWARAESVAREASRIAADLGDRPLDARCEAALAEVARKQGHYDEAVERLAAAVATFREVKDDEGLGLALHVTGTVAAQRGDFDAARRNYLESLEIRTRLNERAALAGLHSNLAIIAQYSGDAAGAREASERALAIRQEIGDLWGIGVSQNNLSMIAYREGNFAEARERSEEAIRLCREAGDPWMVALAHNTLGNAARELGDHAAAGRSYAATLETYRNNDDLWALAYLFEDIALLAAESRAATTAFELLGAAEALRETIGSPRDDEQAAELANQVSLARESLTETEVSAAEARGRAWSTAESIDQALRFALSAAA